MSFFYDLNKKLAALAAKTEQQQIAESKKAEAVAQSPLTKALNESVAVEADYSAKKARAGKDIGKPGKNFSKIAKGAAERYGSKEAGERVAGAVLKKIRAKEDMTDEGNAFTGALAKTPKGGKFKVGSKEFTDTSSIEEAGMEAMTPKQKKFAKLAPPADKITFADKIAGAKKEVDEMLGDVAAEAMRKAVVGHAGEEEMDEGFADMDRWLAQREKEKGTGKFDKRERTLPGGMKATTYTRKHEDDKEDDSDAPTSKGGAPKKRGRPAGAPKGPERVTKGAWKHKGERKVKEASNCCPHCGESLDTEELDEKAVSKKQQKFMGMVHAAQKGEKPASKEVAKVAKEMPKKAAKDFASTKHKGLPEKVKAKKEESKEEVEETTVAGSVATATAAPKAGKGMQFGKGVYEGFNNTVEQMITEGIQMQVAEHALDGDEETLTITATGEDVHRLKELLKLAGLGQESQGCGCGTTPCSCKGLDENSPDWPTNTEVGGKNDPTLQTYSGGLNKPKSTGQTTTPTLGNADPRRQVSMEESVELERSLFDTWKNYKG